MKLRRLRNASSAMSSPAPLPEGWSTAHVQQHEAALLQLIGNPSAWVSTFISGVGGTAGAAAVREIRNGFQICESDTASVGARRSAC